MSHIFVFGAQFKPIEESQRPLWPVQLTVRWPGTPDPWNSLASLRQNGAPDDFVDVMVFLPSDVPSAMDASAIEECIRSYVAHQVAEQIPESPRGPITGREVRTAWRQEFTIINDAWQLGAGGAIAAPGRL